MQKKLSLWLLLLTLALATVYSCQQHEEAEEMKVEVGKSVFFSYGGQDAKIEALITMMELKNDSCEYVDEYLDMYGRPLWDSSLLFELPESSLCIVPIFTSVDSEIESLLIYNMVGNEVSYVTFSKHNEYNKYKSDHWMFDYFTEKVQHMRPKSGLTFEPDTTKTRAWAKVEIVICSHVYSGTAANPKEFDHGVECWSSGSSYTYVEDPHGDTTPTNSSSGTGTYNPSHGGGGGSGTGSSGGNNPPSPDGLDITKFLNLKPTQANLKNRLDSLSKLIKKDCMGETLLKCVTDSFNNKKMNVMYSDTSAYNLKTNTLKIRKSATSDELLHELIHAYQLVKSSLKQFQKRTLNMELEAHLLQFKFMRRRKMNLGSWTKSYKSNLRLRGIARLNKYIDDHGRAIKKERNTLAEAEIKAENAVSIAYLFFSVHEKYGTFNGIHDYTLAFNFSNLRNLTKNC